MTLKVKMKYVKIVLLFVGVAVVAGLYLYNKPVASTSGKSADLSIRAEDLFNAFASDEEAANHKYLDKVVSISGTVSNVAVEDGLNIVTLKTASDMFGVICKMEGDDEAVKTVKAGDKVKIKGVCTGMLMDVVFVRCVIDEE